MERRHVLEEEEDRLCIQSERLKRQKELLMMNAKIAAYDAKLAVLKTCDVGSSKMAPSDDSKYKRSHSSNHNSKVQFPVNSTQIAMHNSITRQAYRMAQLLFKIIQFLILKHRFSLHYLFICKLIQNKIFCTTLCRNRQILQLNLSIKRI